MHQGVELVTAGADHNAPGAAQVEAKEIGFLDAAGVVAHHLKAVVLEGGHHGVEGAGLVGRPQGQAGQRHGSDHQQDPDSLL